MKRAFAILCLAVAGWACEDKIVEYHYTTDKVFTNDLLHGYLIGRVKQIESDAIVYVSQVAVIDSTAINVIDCSFVFDDLRAGNYDLKIVADNFRTYRRLNVQIPGGAITYAGEIELSKIPDLIAEHYPMNGDEIVYDWRYGRIAISIYFDKPMDRASVEAAFSTQPASEGIFSWGTYTRAPYSGYYPNDYSDPSGYRPESGATITTYSKIMSMTYVLAQKDAYTDTAYTVTLSTAAKDTTGEHLRFPLVFSFRTVQAYTSQYGILSSPTHGDINVEPLNFSGIRITFPRRMEPVSTEAATSITPSMNRVFLWPEENQLLICPGGPFLTDTTITVTIGPTAHDNDGVEFLNFNTYVKLSSVSGSIHISPALAGTFSYDSYYGTNDYPYHIVFTPSSPMASNTKYTVVVTTGVHDMFDVPLKQEATFSFVTRPN